MVRTRAADEASTVKLEDGAEAVVSAFLCND